MARQATGSVEYRRAKDGTGAWFGRVTAANGKRVRMRLGDWPNSKAGKARAVETAKHWTEKIRGRDLGAVSPKTEKKDRTASTQTAAAWWTKFFTHRGELGMRDTRGMHTTHILPVVDIGWPEIKAADAERLRDTLDARVAAGELAPKTAFNAWTLFRTAGKAACGKWSRDKRRTLKVRDDDPADGVVGPDFDPADGKQLQWLYPREVIAVAGCDAVPLAVRRRIVLSTYLAIRAGELKALTWQKIDLERGVVIVDEAFDRDRGVTKRTKTGNRGARRYAIEPTLIPLLQAMHDESSGSDLVIEIPDQKYWARELREALAAAGVTRPELFSTTATSKRLRFHDLRASGLTWMAIRGDSPGDVQHVAGHTDYAMTRKYIDAGGRVDLLPGETVFPELPPSLLGASARLPQDEPSSSGPSNGRANGKGSQEGSEATCSATLKSADPIAQAIGQPTNDQALATTISRFRRSRSIADRAEFLPDRELPSRFDSRRLHHCSLPLRNAPLIGPLWNLPCKFQFGGCYFVKKSPSVAAMLPLANAAERSSSRRMARSVSPLAMCM